MEWNHASVDREPLPIHTCSSPVHRLQGMHVPSMYSGHLIVLCMCANSHVTENVYTTEYVIQTPHWSMYESLVSFIMWACVGSFLQTDIRMYRQNVHVFTVPYEHDYSRLTLLSLVAKGDTWFEGPDACSFAKLLARLLSSFSLTNSSWFQNSGESGEIGHSPTEVYFL